MKFLFESFRVPFVQPEKPRHYTPDFLLLASGIVIESKGIFPTSERQKHLLVKQQHPDLDLRFVFSRSASRISKQSRTTYALWCQTNGFLYADRDIPEAWLLEPINYDSLACVKRLQKGTPQ